MSKSIDDRSPAAADARYAELEGDESVIPAGLYCYRSIGMITDPETGFPRMQIAPCPYWATDPSRRDQMNGYCAKFGSGDWDAPSGAALLWDRVKECGINEGEFEDQEDN